MIESNIKVNNTPAILIRQLVSQRRGLTANPHYLAVNGTFLVMDDQDTMRNIFGLFIADKKKKAQEIKKSSRKHKGFQNGQNKSGFSL